METQQAAQVARFMGYFSVGLGLSEVLATKGLTEYFGMEERARVVRAFGIREIVAGIGLLSQPQSGSHYGAWMWARAGGDALDLVAIGMGCTPDNPKRVRAGVAWAVVAAITALDIVCAVRLSRAGR